MSMPRPSLLTCFNCQSLVSALRSRLANHPRGFYLLCLAVLCERWAASILASSLVFMLCERYGYPRSASLRLGGLYNAASYLLTLPGGFAIDRLLGARRAFGAGMALLTCGYAALTISSPLGLWLAGMLLLLGHSLFKPSTQAIIVLLYDRNDPRLDAAQVGCYFVINVAVTAGSLCAGLFMRAHDFRSAFTLAAAGALTGTLAVFAGRSVLGLRQKRFPFGIFAATVPGALSSQQRVGRIAALTLAMMLFTVGVGQVDGSLLLWAQDRADCMLRAIVTAHSGSS